MSALPIQAWSMPLTSFLDDEDSFASERTSGKGRIRKTLYAFLATLADPNTGLCWASTRAIEQAIGISGRTVRKATEWLSDAGLLQKRAIFTGQGQMPNVFVLVGLVESPDEQAIAAYLGHIAEQECGPNWTGQIGDKPEIETPPASVGSAPPPPEPVGSALLILNSNSTNKSKNIRGAEPTDAAPPPASSPADNQDWWISLSALIIRGKGEVQKIGFDAMLEDAAKPKPPRWLKEWMLPEAHNSPEIAALANSEAFRLYWAMFLYHKHHDRKADYQARRGVNGELLKLARNRFVIAGGRIDTRMAGRICLMAIMKRWQGLPQPTWEYAESDIPRLIREWNAPMSQSRPRDEAAEARALDEFVPAYAQPGKRRGAGFAAA